MGGEDSPDNLINLPVTRHAMFHYCSWKLWGDKRDWLAWKGLRGEIGREEIIHLLRKEGGRIGSQKSNAKGFTEARRAHFSKISELGAKAALSEAARSKRKKSIKEGIESLSEEQRIERFSREQTKESRDSKSSKIRSFRSITVETPDGIKTVEGSQSSMAEQLGIRRESMQPLLRAGKIVKLGFRLISFNPW
jgi:hypothetical protein